MPEKDAIDLFDLLEIILKRKYLVICFVIIAVLGASFYSYVILPKGPQGYSVQAVAAPTISGLTLDKVTAWFSSGVYKAALQEQHKGSSIPDIASSVTGNKRLKLRMTSSNASEGRQMMGEVVKILNESSFVGEMKKEFFERQKAKEEAVKAKEEAEKDLKALDYETKLKLLDLDQRSNLKELEILKSQKNNGEKLKVMIDEQLADLVSRKSRYQEADSDSKWKYYQSLDLIAKLSNDLNNQITKIGLSLEYVKGRILRNTNEREVFKQKWKYEAEDKDAIEEAEESKIVDEKIDETKDSEASKIVDEKNTFKIEGSVYVSKLPKEQKPRARIVGIAAIVGLFIGCFIAFLAEVRNRRSIA